MTEPTRQSLADGVTPENLVSAAGQNLERRCEAHYSAGETCRIATGVEVDPVAFPLTPMNEYDLAQWR